MQINNGNRCNNLAHGVQTRRSLLILTCPNFGAVILSVFLICTESALFFAFNFFTERTRFMLNINSNLDNVLRYDPNQAVSHTTIVSPSPTDI